MDPQQGFTPYPGFGAPPAGPLSAPGPLGSPMGPPPAPMMGQPPMPWQMPPQAPPGPGQHSPLAQMLLRSVKPSQPAPQPPVDMGRFQGALAAFGQR